MRKSILILMTLLIIGCTDTNEHVKAPEPPHSLPGSGDDAGRTLIYRDTFGIPHIYAPTVEDGLYAQGWAQAADRPTQLLLNLKIAMGQLTEISGEAGVSASLVSHMFGHMRNAIAAVDGMSDAERKRMTAFANGISDYYDKHPDQVPDFWQDERVTPAMIDAFGRMFLYNWSIDEALGDLQRGGIEPQFVTTQRGSNQWAISPSRTASGHAILLIDPHLSWWGVSRFWEMRVHAGDWHGSGVGLAGSPYIGLGHNANLAWAMTTGGPDTADVFRLTLDKNNPLRYRYDGQWRELTQHTVPLTFPDGSVKEYTWESSHHGPIIARQDGFAYAARIAYDSGTNRNEAWEALNFAKDYRGAVEACATLSFFPQNVMVADTSGNIYYQRTGRVPVRPENFDWSKPVDGSSSTSEWQGFHPSSDHLQLLNPAAGYMQNCNIPPDAMLPNSPFTLEAQPAYLFSSAAHGEQFDGWTNQRGARAIELLSRDSEVTVDEALAYAVDIIPFGYARWLEVVRQSAISESPQLAELLAWDGRLQKDSTAALKYYYWRAALHDSDGGTALRERVDDHYSVVTGRAPAPPVLSDADKDLVRNTWTQAMSTMQEQFGERNPVWGDVFRVGRDDQSWPVEGGGGDHLGLTTLRSMGYDEPNERHERWGNRGQTSTQVVVLSKPIQSWIYLPVGQSDDPASAHYTDQAASVFTNRKLKPSWWLPEDLQPHIVSREELQPRY
jgi:acyl-homoserine lactone acylase PvdQ